MKPLPGGEDDETAALEAEFEAAAAADAEAMGALRERAARERARGRALRNQRAVWEAVLEQRILLQRCLQARGAALVMMRWRPATVIWVFVPRGTVMLVLCLRSAVCMPRGVNADNTAWPHTRC